MPEEPTHSEIQIRIRELLGRATLLRARGERQQALQLAREAAGLDATGWEAHELIGDLLLDIGHGEQALESYRRALELNKSRGMLEEKIGRAALARAARLRAVTLSSAVLEGKARPVHPRKPAMAALLSLIVPGLGQLTNGEAIKGFVMLAVFLLLFALTGLSLRGQIAASPPSPRGALYGPQINVGAIISGLLGGVGALWVILLLALWVYSITDAAIRASRAADADHSGVG